jgi:LysM repeat protein
LAKKYNLNLDVVKEINSWTPKTVWHVGDKIKLPRSHAITQAVDSVKVVPPAVAKVPTTEVAVTKPSPDTVAKTTAATQPQGIQGTYIVQKKETLYSIGKRFKVSPEQIRTWNNLPNNNIAEGQSLILYTSQPFVQPELAATKPPAAPVVERPAPSQQPKVVEAKPTASTNVPPVVPTVSQKPAEAVAQPVAEEGYFTPLFGKGVGKNLQTVAGAAMTFKTASGWADKKYYILMDDVSPGGVVKITNAAGKSLYAKVLWSMGDARDNDGLNFRVSDAAASALGIKDAKFNITVSFYK